MKSMIHNKILEKICSLGCNGVHKTIADLSANKPIPIINSLTLNQRSLVLSELRDIMAVYQRS